MPHLAAGELPRRSFSERAIKSNYLLMSKGNKLDGILQSLEEKSREGEVTSITVGDYANFLDTIRSSVPKIVCTKHFSTPFFILDLGKVVELFLDWVEMLPRVRPFYAVKCNQQPALLKVLALLGAGFDCASEKEMKQILGLGIPPQSIVYANACKLESHIKYAAATGIHLSTFDSKEEVKKIKALDNNARLLLRIATDDEGATIRLSSKYGARMSEVPDLLMTAADVGLPVVGVAFHIGSGAINPASFAAAIVNARSVFDMAVAMGMPSMSILDIGGGFSGRPEGGVQLREAAAMINTAIDNYFPEEMGVEVIAEPGRYFACTPFTLLTRIFGKRERDDLREYWINDGVNGSFTMLVWPHGIDVPAPIPVACKSNPSNVLCSGMPLYSSNLFGPTCSSLDMVLKQHPLPELSIDDWLAFADMGDYTYSLATQFNGFSVMEVPAFCIMFASDKARLSSRMEQYLHEERAPNGGTPQNGFYHY